MAPATAKAEKVIFAETAVTIHLLDGVVQENPDGSIFEPVTGKVLLPGDTVALTDVPSYLRKLVEEGKAPGLSLLTPNQAKRLVSQAERAKTSISALVEPDEDEE